MWLWICGRARLPTDSGTACAFLPRIKSSSSFIHQTLLGVQLGYAYTSRIFLILGAAVTKVTKKSIQLIRYSSLSSTNISMSDDIDEIEALLKPSRKKQQVLVLSLGISCVLGVLLSYCLFQNMDYLYVMISILLCLSIENWAKSHFLDAR